MGSSTIKPFLENSMVNFSRKSKQNGTYGSHSRAEDKGAFRNFQGSDLFSYCLFIGGVEITGIDGVFLINKFKEVEV